MIPIIKSSTPQKTNLWYRSIRVVVAFGKMGLTGIGNRKIFWSDGNVLYF